MFTIYAKRCQCFVCWPDTHLSQPQFMPLMYYHYMSCSAVFVIQVTGLQCKQNTFSSRCLEESLRILEIPSEQL